MRSLTLLFMALGSSFLTLAQTESQEHEIHLVTPRGGEQWRAGTEQIITWKSSEDISKIVLQYKPETSAGWICMDTVDASAHLYLWQVPHSFSNQAWIKIACADDANKADHVDEAFEIVPVLISAIDHSQY